MRPSGNKIKIERLEQIKVFADEQVKQYNYAKAIALYTSVLDVRPDDSDVRIKRSKAYFNLRQYDQSLSDAKELIKQFPQESEGYIQAASTLLLTASSEQASKEVLMQGIEAVKQQSKRDQILSLLEKIAFLFQQQTSIKLFVQWANAAEIKFSAVEISVSTPFQRLVRAIRNIKILLIPRSAIMCLDDALDFPIVKKLNQNSAKLCSVKHTYLSIYLLIEKQKKQQSIFASYLNILPNRFPTSPINFTPDEMALLKGSFFSQQIKQKRQQILSDYNQIIKCCPQFSFSLDQFSWARLVVSSRVFGITIKQNRTQALVPFADMCNHSERKQTFWTYNEELEGFVLESIIDIKAGLEIVDSYGKKYNSKFLLNYGFVIQDNDLSEVIVPIPYDMVKDRSSKSKVWERLFGNRILLRLTSNNHQSSFSVLMSIMRFIICSEQELNQIQRAHLITLSEGVQPPLVDFYNIDLERKCITQLCALLKKHMDSYPTTLQQDEQLLKQDNLSINVRNCIILRKEEKELLLHCIKIETLIEKLSKARKVNRKKMLEQKDYLSHKRYLEKILSI